MYAIIKTGGKQYKVEPGQKVKVEKLDYDVDEEVVFDQVKLVSDDDGLKVGQPTLEDAAVTAKVVEQGKGDKIVIFKYKPKNNYRRKTGHRQPYTEVEIEKIEA